MLLASEIFRFFSFHVTLTNDKSLCFATLWSMMVLYIQSISCYKTFDRTALNCNKIITAHHRFLKSSLSCKNFLISKGLFCSFCACRYPKKKKRKFLGKLRRIYVFSMSWKASVSNYMYFENKKFILFSWMLNPTCLFSHNWIVTME